MLNESSLDDLLTQPTRALVTDVKNIDGDIVVLGAGGKMGPSLCLLLKNAIDMANISSKVIAVSRFSDDKVRKALTEKDICCIEADLADPLQVRELPDSRYVIYMAGRKFGTHGKEHLTWGMNVVVPSLAAQKYKDARIVVFSSGNIYPMMPLHTGGARETTPPDPIGEYAMSCLGRERVFDYFACTQGTRCLLFRLNYAIALRYGVLCDLAQTIASDSPVDLATPAFNCIWQRDANEMAIRSLHLATSPPAVLNITGPETASTRAVADQMGTLLGRKPVFTNQEGNKALLSHSGKAVSIFGYPNVSLETMIRWQAEWMLTGGSCLGKPTHFDERGGQY